MQEGFSTAPDNIRELGFGAGMGLPNMSRSADKFEIISSKEEGTQIHMMVHH
jgi:serine/threonine-protein kinase RsbT